MDSEKIVKQAFNLKWCLENSVLPVYSDSEKKVIVALSDEKHINALGNFINKRIKENLGLETKYEIRPRPYILDKLSAISDGTKAKETKINQTPIDEKIIEIRNSKLMEGPLFAQDELAKIYLLPLEQKKAKLRKQFSERINKAPYSLMSAQHKFAYCQKQIEEINKENSMGCFIVGFILLTAAGLLITPFGESMFASILAFISLILVLCFSNEIWRNYFSRNGLLVPLYEAEKRNHAAQANQEIAATNLQANLNSQELFDRMLAGKLEIKTSFSEYKAYIGKEIELASPDQNAVRQAAAAKDIGNAFSLHFLGVIGDDYTPAEDARYSKLIRILDRERDRVKQLAHEGHRLPFVAIEYFQDISRSYYGLQRPGGNASIYDETLIQNEVTAMKEDISVKGDYVDNRVNIDRSTKRTTQNITNIQNATIDNGEYTPEKITKEILKLILTSSDEAASRVEIMAAIAVDESLISEALEQMQIKGQLQISNRSTGEIVYKLDRLA